MARRRLLTCVLLSCVSFSLYAQNWQSLLPSKACAADSSIYGLAIDSSGRVLVVGEDGLVYASFDRSGTYTPARIGAAVDLYDAGFPSPSSLAACGDSGIFLRSSDNGTTWERMKHAGFEARAHYAMCWLDSGTALLGGGSRAVAHGSVAVPDGYILRSSDGGNTWTPTFLDAGSFVWVLATDGAGAARRCFAGVYGPLSGGRILMSTDAGEHWSVAVNNLPFLPHDIAPLPDGRGIIAVGGNPFVLSGNPRIVLMDASGRWTILPDSLPAKGFAWSVATTAGGAGPTNRVFLGTQSGSILISENDGLDWRVDTGSDVIRCPVYALARRRFDNPTAAELTLAAGSGRGLFRREAEPRSAASPPLVVSPHLAVDVFPQPVPAGNGRRLMIHIYNLVSAPLQLVLVDIAGRTIRNTDCGTPSDRNQNMWMDLQEIPAGVYVLQVVNGERAARARVSVLQRTR